MTSRKNVASMMRIRTPSILYKNKLLLTISILTISDCYKIPCTKMLYELPITFYRSILALLYKRSIYNYQRIYTSL